MDNVNNKLTAPGRMDVVEQVLTNDPYFKARMVGLKPKSFVNRRGIKRCYNPLTVQLVTKLSEEGLDAVEMRREEVIAKAVQWLYSEEAQLVA
jgi:hypothetical protein